MAMVQKTVYEHLMLLLDLRAIRKEMGSVLYGIQFYGIIVGLFISD